MTWTMGLPSARGMDAAMLLAEPSLPQPLPGSTPMGAGKWWLPKPAAHLHAAYLAAAAPVPPGSTVHQESDSVLRVDSPVRESAIVLTERPGGCVYTIAGSPTLQLAADGLVGDIDVFVRVAAAPFDSTGLGFIAEVELDGAAWAVVLLADPEIPAAGEEHVMTLALIPGKLERTLDFDLSQVELQGRGEARPESGSVVATASITGKSVNVRAVITDGLAAVLPELQATLEVSKKWGRHGSRPRLTGADFEAKERIGLTLGDRKMPSVAADNSGGFTKMLQVPADFPLGKTEISASGEQSKRVATVPYEVRPPR